MANDAPKTRRSRTDTTIAIEASAIRLVIEHGYDHVTVDMICDAAGVSQRTFFNYFKTKDAALLGDSPPRIDERKARAFIVSSGPLLAEAVGLIDVRPVLQDGRNEIFADRIVAISSHPELMMRQMEKFAAIHEEIREIVLLRLSRDQPGPSPELEKQAELITHMLAGVMRYIAGGVPPGRGDGRPPQPAAGVEDLLAQVLTKLS